MQRLKLSVLATAILAGFYAVDAFPLALGPITVRSALGEPLRAEIDLLQITPAEADALRATIASPDVFRTQGVEYTQAVNNLQIQLQRRPDGTAMLRLTGERPVNEPFVDLVLDASWGSGRIVRSYTMLFDPSTLHRAAPAVTAAPQISAAAAPVASSAPVTAPRSDAVSQALPAASPATAPRPKQAGGAGAPPPAGVTVQPGSTASHIAHTYKPQGVSLDQMLVALLRANPNAFIHDNVNRLKAGAVLQLPDQAAAQSIPAPEARQIVAAQVRDFNAFRHKLAGVVPTVKLTAAQRSASGTVRRTQVEDRKPATTAPDKLMLSKGSVKGQKTAEEKLAKEKQAGESAMRLAELSKNITDLNKLGAGSTKSSVAADHATADTTTAPAAVTIQTPAIPATPTAAEVAPPVSGAASNARTEVDVAAPTAPVIEPAPAPPKPRPTSAPAPVQEPDFLSTLMADPLLPIGGGVVLAGLLGFGAYRFLQRRRQHSGTSSDENRAPPDSFFGASGGQRVDTANAELAKGGSVMAAYSPSQLDAGGDVDPVAEAEVYLAYGRDLQAEEILKEAVRHNPGRVSVHLKLGEIYAKRKDRKALEVVAGDVFKLTQGEGLDWSRIVELGRGLDPDNRLYQPGGRLGSADSIFPPPDRPFGTAAGHPVAAPGLDLDLDSLQLPDVADLPAAPKGSAAAPAAAGAAGSDRGKTNAAVKTGKSVGAPETLRSGLDSQTPGSAFFDSPVTRPVQYAPRSPDAAPTPLPNAAPAAKPNVPSAADPMEFMTSLSLDLEAPSKPVAAPASADDDGGLAAAQDDPLDDPLATKLALAEEFDAIGDVEGARTLIEEVLAESSGALKTRAQRMLAQLG